MCKELLRHSVYMYTFSPIMDKVKNEEVRIGELVHRKGVGEQSGSESIIIIIRKGRQCKAGRERLTPYQSEDPNPTTPTHRMKEEKGKTVEDKK